MPLEDPDPPPRLHLTPESAVLVSGPTAALQITAQVTGTLYTWDGRIHFTLWPDVGTLHPGAYGDRVTYFVQSVPAVTTVRITAVAAELSASATIVVQPPRVEVAPEAVTLTRDSGPVAFEAALLTGGTVSWSLSPDVGTLSAPTGRRVTYAAPASIPTRTVVSVVASAEGVASGTATITLQPVDAAPVLRVTPEVKTVRAGGGPITLTATRENGASGPVTWSLHPPIDAGSLDATVGDTVQYMPPSSTGDVRSVFIYASAEGPPAASGEATINVHAPSVVSVHGIVGSEGAEVHIGEATAVTSADGTFTIADVTTPYSVVLVLPALGRIVEVDGLTRPDPVLTPRDEPPSRPVRLAGNILGRSSDPALVPVILPEEPLSTTGAMTVDATGAYTADLTSRATGAIEMHVLEVERPPELDGVSRYGRSGSAAAPIPADGGLTPIEVNGFDIQLGTTAVPMMVVTGSVELPAGMTGTIRGASEISTTRGLVSWAGSQPAPGSFRMLAPVLAGAWNGMLIVTAGDDQRGASVSTSFATYAQHPIQIRVDPPPVGFSPASGTPMAATDPVQWRSGTGYVHVVSYRCGGLEYRLVTRDSEVRLPSVAGYELASGTRCTGRLTRTSYWSVDDFASGLAERFPREEAFAPAPELVIQ